jgi:GTP-binding protein
MMHFWDEVVIRCKAGDGGNGAISFASDPINPKGGPDGGDGGNGGGIVFKASASIYDLTYFSFHRTSKAMNGENGGRNKRTGKSGETLQLNLPVGTLVYIWNQEKRDFKKLFEFKKPSDEFLLASGGRGGQGNAHLSGLRHSEQKKADPGEKTKIIKLKLVLKLIADVGLVGLPNAGKSTLLSVITSAKPKIGDYPFTTLTPNLGVVEVNRKKIVIADIPGLIEGAHEGRGLGVKFLKHVERTRLLVWLISADSRDPFLDWQTLRQELESYNKKFAKEKKIILLTKIDLNPDYQKLVNKLEKKIKASVIPISSTTHQNLDLFLKTLSELI